ncbi:hypothetical protein RP20_CCG005930 [Aedes albopictus]|nr:hypothetical protein RP20_CCG005930 [Aedes albopictus]
MVMGILKTIGGRLDYDWIKFSITGMPQGFKCLRKFLKRFKIGKDDVIMANKVITILSVVLFAFVISTTVLAVQKNDLEAENEELRAQLDSTPTEFSSTTTDTEETTLEPSAPTTTISMETSPAPTTVTTQAPTTEPPQDPSFYRLPGTVVPVHYDLWLHPNLEDGTFSGRVAIDVTVLSRTRQFVLHSSGLTINGYPTFKPETTTSMLTTYNFDLEREFLTITINNIQDILPDTNGTLTIEFSGTMSGKIVGLYSSSYPGDNGETM